jgi:hypothetical protein
MIREAIEIIERLVRTSREKMAMDSAEVHQLPLFHSQHLIG